MRVWRANRNGLEASIIVPDGRYTGERKVNARLEVPSNWYNHMIGNISPPGSRAMTFAEEMVRLSIGLMPQVLIALANLARVSITSASASSVGGAVSMTGLRFARAAGLPSGAPPTTQAAMIMIS